MSLQTILILVFIGLSAGFFSGFFGIGGGIIIIPMLIVFLGLTQHEAQGTVITLMLPPIGILAAINYFKKGVVNWEYAIIISCVFVIGAYMGSKITLNTKPELATKFFGIILFLVSLKLIFSK